LSSSPSAFSSLSQPSLYMNTQFVLARPWTFYGCVTACGCLAKVSYTNLLRQPRTSKGSGLMQNQQLRHIKRKTETLREKQSLANMGSNNCQQWFLNQSPTQHNSTQLSLPIIPVNGWQAHPFGCLAVADFNLGGYCQVPTHFLQLLDGRSSSVIEDTTKISTQ